jgi:hypothetical protein
VRTWWKCDGADEWVISVWVGSRATIQAAKRSVTKSHLMNIITPF